MTMLRDLDSLDPALRGLCKATLRAARVPGASITIVAGDRGYHHAYGVKSLRTGEPVTAATSFNIGSCSKAFVSAAVAALVAEGRVAWNDPVAPHVPELQLYDPWVTQHVSFRDFSANRLGLPRVGLANAGIDPAVPVADLLGGLRHVQPLHPFRERFTYVNMGHVANAMAVGRITGQGFLAVVRERILEPLGMRGTSGGAATPSDLHDLSGWHTQSDSGVVAIDPFYSDQRLGAGGMFVSGQDAVQWLRLHLNGGLVDGRQVVAREALLETHRPHTVAIPGQDIHSLFYPGAQMAAYALGWAVSDLEGHPMVCHSGVDYGAGAMTMLFPKAGIGIAVYGNLQMAGPVPTAYALAAALLGLAPRDWRAYFEALAPAPASVAADPSTESFWPPTDLARYEGRYTHVADGSMIIERDAEGLHGNVLRGYRMAFRLKRVGEDRFALKFIHAERQFMATLDPPLLQFQPGDHVAKSAELFIGPIGQVFSRDV